jgi:hypothetical protein
VHETIAELAFLATVSNISNLASRLHTRHTNSRNVFASSALFVCFVGCFTAHQHQGHIGPALGGDRVH